MTAKLVVRVLPDVPAIDKRFDYLVPAGMRDEMRVGTIVRVPLHGRRVGAWVTDVGVDPPPGVALRDVAKVTGWGPAPELFDLAAWAAWRWAGRPASLLTAASPPGAVRNLPPSPSPLPSRDGEPSVDAVAADALGRRRGVLRLPPGADRYPLVRAAATAAGHALVLCPTIAQARQLAGRLGRDGHPVACVAHDRPGAAATGGWARAAAGATVVGARGGAWAPVRDIGRIVVLDEHDESYKAEQSPTWHARDVAIERAARAGVPCLLVSPCPTLEALAWGDLMVPSRATERRGWSTLEVVDRRLEDPVAAGLYSDRLVTMVRGGGRVLCVVNRRGRARLLACAACGELARCEVCAASVEQLERTTLRCRRCATERPVVCLRCGASRLKNLRAGVARVREELEALAGEPVAEITAATATKDEPDGPESRIYAGTEAVLHQVPVADAVAFLDFDQELTAPRYRAAEQALALLARAARVVRGRAGGGRVLVQTRQPDHPVLAAARHADPARVTDVEASLRRALRLPPAAAVALVSGPSAPSFIDALGTPPGVEVAAAAGGAWRLRADDHRTLCDALAAVSRPPGRLRIEVDPLRM